MKHCWSSGHVAAPTADKARYHVTLEYWIANAIEECCKHTTIKLSSAKNRLSSPVTRLQTYRLFKYHTFTFRATLDSEPKKKQHNKFLYVPLSNGFDNKPFFTCKKPAPNWKWYWNSCPVNDHTHQPTFRERRILCSTQGLFIDKSKFKKRVWAVDLSFRRFKDSAHTSLLILTWVTVRQTGLSAEIINWQSNTADIT